MEVKVIDGNDVALLGPMFEHLGWAIPVLGASKAIVAIEEGRVVGFAIVQIMPHLEPVWVDVSHRGNGLADRLVQKAAEEMMAMGIDHWVSLIRNDQSKRLAQAIGMVLSPGEVFVKP